ncbi:acetyl esterase/lipase [Pedobacter sp. CG_S7]|uniref:alpha/beta hydrolase n=1 Tax=Pedobacter sp. CG_S7 TaxID=3143930 RepID=UPI003391593B
MSKILYALSFILLFTGHAMAQTVIPIYPGAIPRAKPVPTSFKEISSLGADGVLRISKVSIPTLTAYLPAKEKATGTAVIICPGGGYGILAIGHEGYDIAKEFNKLGVAAFVLKYRLPDDEIMSDKGFGPFQDIQQAMYVVRKNAAKWNLKVDKIGVMGFSAGGHLASSMSVHYNDVRIEAKDIDLRPDFSILIYPVISAMEQTHAGSVKNLLGVVTTDTLKIYFSNQRSVTKATPPSFLVHAIDDKTVPVYNSISYGQALIKHNVPAEMHLYQSGGHGFGLNNKTTADRWFNRLENWLRMNKLL